MMAVRGVQSGDGDARLIGALAVEHTVAAGTDGSQRFCRHCLQSRLWTLRFQDHRALTVMPWAPLVTAGAQPTRADYVVRDAGFPSR